MAYGIVVAMCPDTEKTISSGAITIGYNGFYTVDTEGDAASDDLDTINGGEEGLMIILKPANGARTVTIKHNTGNIWNVGGVDLDLNDIDDCVLLFYNGSKWTVIGVGTGGGGLSNIVEDTTPQLGGDLDLNTNNIDFPTTPNISDCLDEDNMASDSATKLATQQSIKAYVDANAGGASALSDLSDVNTSTPTDGNVLRADGVDWESTQLNHTDLSSVSSDDHHTKYALTDDLTSAEITQIQNINAVSITNTQWGYLGGMSGQPVETESDPIVGAISGIVKADGASNISAAVEDTDYQGVLTEGAFADGDKTKLDGIESSADVTDATNVKSALDEATITNVAIVSTDKVLFQDASNSDNLRQDDAQTLADLKTTELSEDTTPQLGGDLDLNGNSIDFPTTANISDCLDEDGMASNSTTKLATQQSIKAYADTKLANVSEDASPQLGGALDCNGNNIELKEGIIKLDDTLSGDETYSGITTSGTLGATIVSGDLCYLNNDDGRWELADANLSDGYDKLLGICLSGGNDGNSTTILLYGKIRSAAFSAFTIGNKLYMSETAGDITHTAPTTASACRRGVGFAVTAEDLMFIPESTIVVNAA